MAPILVQFQPVFDAIVQDFTVLSASYSFTGLAGATTDMQERMDAAQRLPVDVLASLTLAHDGLAVLDRHPPEHCWADYAAALRTGWLSYGDAAQSLQAGDLASSNKDIGVALYLLGPRGDLLHSQAVKECAA